MICLIKFLDKSKLLFKLTICPHYVAPAILYKKISIIQNNLLANILMFLCILCSVLEISFSFLRRIVVHNINDTGSFKTSTLKKFELPVNKYEINLGHFKNNHDFNMVL